jgi:hypothetical protein
MLHPCAKMWCWRTRVDLALGEVMLDLYSKIVFSVIAVALVVIAWNGLGNGRAVAALGEGCGSRSNPCHVTTRETIDVNVTNAVHLRN